MELIYAEILRIARTPEVITSTSNPFIDIDKVQAITAQLRELKLTLWGLRTASIMDLRIAA